MFLLPPLIIGLLRIEEGLVAGIKRLEYPLMNTEVECGPRLSDISSMPFISIIPSIII